MKSWIGLRITAEIDGNGPALLRRLLPEIAAAVERKEFGIKVPDSMQLGDVLVELGAGPAPQQPPADPEVAPKPSPSPEPAQGAAVRIEVLGDG
jgi:hypothetical protein